MNMALEKDLSKILSNLSESDIKLIKAGKLSEAQIKFITSGINSKIDDIMSSSLYYSNLKKLSQNEIPKEILYYNSIYHNYDDEISHPVIESERFDFGKLAIISSTYNTNHMASTDHMDRDYGCKGDFDDTRVFYNNELSVIYASCCSCHSAGPNKFYGFSQENTSFVKVINMSKPVIATIDKLWASVKKRKKIEDVEDRTGLSREQLLKLLK